MKRGGFLKRTAMSRSFKPMKRSWLERDPFSLKRRSKRTNQNLYREEKWKKEVRERDDYTCRFPGCSVRSKSIDAHHIAMRSRRPDLKFQLSNGICLDRAHHNWVHAHQEEAIAMGLLSADSYERAQKELAAA